MTHEHQDPLRCCARETTLPLASVSQSNSGDEAPCDLSVVRLEATLGRVRDTRP